jgi:hypothetical protein
VGIQETPQSGHKALEVLLRRARRRNGNSADADSIGQRALASFLSTSSLL